MSLPSWLVGILVSILITLLGTVFYAGQAYQQVQSLDKRLARIEEHVDTIWSSVEYGPKR
mgnify:CR=1 FL=1